MINLEFAMKNSTPSLSATPRATGKEEAHLSPDFLLEIHQDAEAPLSSEASLYYDAP